MQQSFQMRDFYHLYDKQRVTQEMLLFWLFVSNEWVHCECFWILQCNHYAYLLHFQTLKFDLNPMCVIVQIAIHNLFLLKNSIFLCPTIQLYCIYSFQVRLTYLSSLITLSFNHLVFHLQGCMLNIKDYFGNNFHDHLFYWNIMQMISWDLHKL